MMISLFEVSIAVFVISSAITFIIMMREISSLKNKLRTSSYIEILALTRKLEDLSREIGVLKHQIKDLKIINEQLKTQEAADAGTIRTVPEVRRPIRQRSERRLIETGLTSIEIEVLKILAKNGEMSSSEIKDILGRSREHVSRVLKSLYEKGYLERIENVKPYRYKIKEGVIEELGLNI